MEPESRVSPLPLRKNTPVRQALCCAWRVMQPGDVFTPCMFWLFCVEQGFLIQWEKNYLPSIRRFLHDMLIIGEAERTGRTWWRKTMGPRPAEGVRPSL